MLTVVFNRPVPSPDEKLCTEFDFHVGDHTNLGYWVENYGDAIKLIQADGDEFSHIYNCFHETIPCNLKKSVHIWRGDWAKFIMENW
jgi:hypothetical protein